MGLVDNEETVEAVGKCTQTREVGGVTIHAEYGFGRNPPPPPAGMAFKQVLEVPGIEMAVADHFCGPETHAVNQARMVETVGKNDIVP